MGVMGAMGFAAVKATCPGAGAAGAAACASGDIGAMGFAAVKATGPGAGAAGCLEAPHPIFVGGGRREDARCVGIPAGREHSGRAKVMRRKTRTELAKPGHRNQADVLVCRSALLVACFLHEITSSAPVSRVPRRTRTLTRTVRRPARPALHLTLHRPVSQVSGARAAAVRGSRGSRLLPRCHQRTPWRRHRCRPCRPLSPPRPRRGRRRRSGPAAIGELPSRPCASPPLAASLPPQARAARPARPG